MLGRLLHLGSGGSATPQAPAGSSGASRPILSLESVQEDVHTRNLLFPDAHALHLHRNDQVFPLSAAPVNPSAAVANAFDYSDDIELDVRDVRVIVLQDALGPANASLLFDSHPSPEASSERSPARKDARKPPMSPRGDVVGQGHPSRPFASQSESPQHRQGAFDRRASVHSRSQSYAETDVQRAAREYREELATFSSCIFGNSELMAYKGTSTKVHVVPSDSRPADYPSSVFGDGRGSIGRSSGRSTSKLSQSLSSQAVSPLIGPPVPPTGTTSRHADKKKVLITRLFPVSLVADDADNNILANSRFSDDNAAFPFPGPGEDPSPKKKPQPKQRRTPMYAVVLVVQLPRSSSRLSSAAPLKSIFREYGSYTDQDLFSSSYNSTKAGWSLSGSGNYGDVTDSSYSIDMEDRIDSLTQHWDIIMRTLTHLQSMVATTLHTMLKQADLASPGPCSSPVASGVVSRTPSMSERRGHDMARAKPSKGTTKLVSLLPNCLADDAKIASEVGHARSRVVMGLSAARVVTGQGRWGIWRDEAIWTSRWALAMEHGHFFYNLLTGFLAIHTDWLQALCGPTYRRRDATVRHARNEEDLSLPARTIIVSDDKMAARRIIFLLSAFLPANQQVANSRTNRPSASVSVGGYSPSPPTFVVPILREESLRRKINRLSSLRRASHSRTASQSARGSTVPGQLAQLSLERAQHQRRASDAASIRTTNLPMPGQDLLVRKSSAATTTTVMAETTTPHFSSAQQQRDGHRRRRPGSSGSVAADDLKRSLKRGESSGGLVATASARPLSQGLRWGNLVSGLWSPRRRDSLEDDLASPGTDYRSPVKSHFGRSDRLFEMVEEAALVEETNASTSGRKRSVTGARNVGAARDDATPGQGSFSQVDRTPDPAGAFESPVKTSINAEDGVIDVDVPFPDYIASFESAISSPSSSGYLSTPGFPGGLEFFDQSAQFSIEGDLPLNAAGWLNRFHPDFVLQALPPQDNLLENVKASLRAEPTPIPDFASGHETSERWVDVSSVIIADTTSNSITRHVYRRLIKPKIPAERQGHAAALTANGSIPLTPFILPYECHLEEDVSTSDVALREAIERVIHFTPDTSKGSSTNSSQTPSHSQGSTDSGRTVPDTVSETTQMANTPLDIPRVQCKAVILSTLEDMVRDAVDSRDSNGESHGGSHRHSWHSQNILREAVRQWATNLETAD